MVVTLVTTHIRAVFIHHRKQFSQGKTRAASCEQLAVENSGVKQLKRQIFPSGVTDHRGAKRANSRVTLIWYTEMHPKMKAKPMQLLCIGWIYK